MFDVVTFGETMLRLSPPNFQRLEQTPTLDIKPGGAELNVAVGVSRLGLKSCWVSKLPTNPLGRLVRNKAQEHGVDTSHIIWSKEGRLLAVIDWELCGIGATLNTAFDRYEFDSAAAIIVVIIVIVMACEYGSGYLRRWVQ